MGEVQVASTTDNQEEVNRVAGAAPADTVIKEELDSQVDSEPEKSKPEESKTNGLEKMQKRIDKLTARNSEAESRADREAARAQQLARELEAERAKHTENKEAPMEEVAAPVETLRVRPKLGETINPRTGKPHETQEEYEDDLMDWRDEKNAIQYAKEENERRSMNVLTSYNDRVEEFKVDHEDWGDVVTASTMDIPQGVQMAILEMENGPEVAYFLGKNPQVVKSLNKMSVPTAMAEVGRISARLEGPQDKEKESNQERKINSGPDREPIVSRAPAPIKPLSGHATKSSVPIDEMSYSDYRRIRDQQEKQRFRR